MFGRHDHLVGTHGIGRDSDYEKREQ